MFLKEIVDKHKFRGMNIIVKPELQLVDLQLWLSGILRFQFQNVRLAHRYCETGDFPALSLCKFPSHVGCVHVQGEFVEERVCATGTVCSGRETIGWGSKHVYHKMTNPVWIFHFFLPLINLCFITHNLRKTKT